MKTLDRLYRLLYRYHYKPVRYMFKEIKKRYPGKKLIGVEIGVCEALNAFNYLRTIENIELTYLIDSYGYYEQDGNPRDFSHYEKIAKRRVAPFGKRVKFIKKKSEDAIDMFEDASLDFVYIDGDHSYAAVKNDIKLYYPKVKAGGIFGGDDFCIKFPGVAKAVLEFVEEYNLELHGANRDWWIIKQERI